MRDGFAMYSDADLATISVVAHRWVAQRSSGTLNLSKDQVKNIMLMDARPTNAQYKKVKSMGIPMTVAANELGGQIKSALGIKAVDDTIHDMDARMNTALGTFALGVITDMSLVKIQGMTAAERTKFKFSGVSEKGASKTNFIKVIHTVDKQGLEKPHKNVQVAMDIAKSNNVVYDILVGVNNVFEEPSFAEPTFKQIKKFIKAKFGVDFKVQKEQLNALFKYSHVKWVYDDSFKNLRDTKGFEDFLLELSGTNVDFDKIHEGRREDERAKLAATKRDLDNMMEFSTLTQRDKVWDPFFIMNEAWANIRMGMQGIITPQGSKLHRLFIRPAKQSFRVNPKIKSASSNYSQYVLAISHHLGNDENTKRSVHVATFKKALAWIEANKAPVSTAHAKEFLVEFDAVDYDGFKAYIELQKYNSEAIFTSNISLEMDGKTNGFAIGLMNSPLITKWTDWLGKIGVFVPGSKHKNSSLYAQDKQTTDAYQTLAKKIPASEIPELIKLFGPVTTKGHVNAPWRKLLKSPFTIYMYGASKKSVKTTLLYSSMFNSVEMALYEAAEAKGDVTTPIDVEVMSYDTEVGAIATILEKELTEIRSFYKVVTDAMSIQAALYAKARDAAFKGKDLITKAERAEIEKSLEPMLPRMKGGTGEIIFGKSKKIASNTPPVQIHMAVNGQKSISAGIRHKSIIDPGSATMPVLTHSYDGANIVEALNKHVATTPFLNLHDAAEASPIAMPDIGQTLNEAFLDRSTNYNIIDDVIDSMNKQLKEAANLGVLDGNIPIRDKKGKMHDTPIVDALNELAIRLNGSKRELDAAKAEFSKHSSIRVDQYVGDNGSAVFERELKEYVPTNINLTIPNTEKTASPRVISQGAIKPDADMRNSYKNFRAPKGEEIALFNAALDFFEGNGLPKEVFNNLKNGVWIADQRDGETTLGSYMPGQYIVIAYSEKDKKMDKVQMAHVFAHELGHAIHHAADGYDMDFTPASVEVEYKKFVKAYEASKGLAPYTSFFAHPYNNGKLADIKNDRVIVKPDMMGAYLLELHAQYAAAYLLHHEKRGEYPAITKYIEGSYAKIKRARSGTGTRTHGAAGSVGPGVATKKQSGNSKNPAHYENAVSPGREKALFAAIGRSIRGVGSPIWDVTRKTLWTLPWMLESFKVPGADRVISEFYHKTRTKVTENISGKTQVFRESLQNRTGEYQTQFDRIFKGMKDRDIATEQKQILDAIINGDKLSAKGVKVKAVFDEMFDNILAEQTKMGMKPADRIQKRENYIPHIWDEIVVAKNKDLMFKLFDEYTPKVDKEDMFDKLSTRGSDALFRDAEEFSQTPASIKRDKHRILNIPTDVLLKHGLIRSSLGDIFTEYNHGVAKGLEWNERFGGYVHTDFGTQWDPSASIHSHVRSMKVMGATEKQVDMFSKAMLALEGRLGLDMNDSLYKTQGWALALVNWLILPLALTSQLPDLVGPAIRGDAGLKDSWKGMQDAFKAMRSDPKLLQETAEWWGIVTEKNVQHAVQEQYEHGFMYEKAHKWNDKLFKYNGMQAFTRFSRLMALSMGEQSMLKWAASGDKANLEALGLTKEAVDTWVKNGKRKPRPSAANVNEKLIIEAMTRFVDEAVMRPDATQRPIWASDPKWTLLWHLKQFMYSFQLTIMNQVGREAKQHANGGAYARAMLPILTVATTIPLGLMGLLLRDTIRYAMADEEPPERDFADAMERSGLYSIAQVFLDVQKQGEWGNNPLLGVTGPTISKISDIYTTEDWGRKFTKSLPILNQFKVVQ